MSQARLTSILAAVGIFVVGLVLGRLSSRAPSTEHLSTTTPSGTPAVAPPEEIPANPTAPSASAAEAVTPAAAHQSSGDVIAALKRTLGGGRNRRMYNNLSTLVDSVDLTNMQEVLDFAQKLPRQHSRSMVVQMLVSRWGELAPRDAMAFADAIPTVQEKNSAIRSAIGGWAETDPKAAIAYVQQMPAGPTRDQAMQSALGAMAEKDPQGALAILQSTPALQTRSTSAYWIIFQRWAASDPAAAANETLRLPPNFGRDNAIQAVVGAWVWQDAEGAFAWASSLPSGAARNRALQSALSNWANREPSKAAEKAMSLPASSSGINRSPILFASGRSQMFAPPLIGPNNCPLAKGKIGPR